MFRRVRMTLHSEIWSKSNLRESTDSEKGDDIDNPPYMVPPPPPSRIVLHIEAAQF